MAAENSTTEVAAPDKSSTSKKPKKIPGLFIRSARKEGFRRCGFEFNAEGFGIALSALTDDQVKMLRKEPMLVVQDIEIDAADIRAE